MSDRAPSCEVSIVIPVYNQAELTRRCLESLFASFPDERERAAAEVIVIDDASYDETPRLLERWQSQAAGLRAIRMPSNLGFAAACNRGVAEAKGTFVLLLNNDTVVLPDAIGTALRSIRSNDAIGVLGARLLYPTYTIQHAGIALDEDLCSHHVFRGLPAEHPFVLARRSFQAVTGAFLLCRRALYEEVGGLDEGYKNAFEDIDFCLRVREAGKEVVYDPEVVLFHYESMSEGRTARDRENHRRFRERWRGRASADLAEKRSFFAARFRDALAARVQERLESGRSPYRSVPYARWASDPEAAEFRALATSLVVCEEALARLRAEDELAAVKRGPSFRIGRAITWLPRRIWRSR